VFDRFQTKNKINYKDIEGDEQRFTTEVHRGIGLIITTKYTERHGRVWYGFFCYKGAIRMG
jgi:hypothetical protein